MARRRQLPRATRVPVTSLASDGIGEGEAEGFRLRVRGALPGERVSVRVLRRGRSKLLAIAETVAEPNPDRVPPPCPWTARCGGCVLQHVDPAVQRAAKRERLRALFAQEGVPAPPVWLDDVVGPALRYRHKARLGVRRVPGRDGVLIGFREPGSSRVAEVDVCRILAPAVGERIGELRTLLGGLSVAAAIPQLEVACGEDRAALILRHLEPLTDDDRQRLGEWSAARGVDLYSQAGGPDSVVRLFPDSGAERLHYSLPEFGLRLAFHPLDFVQINPAINRHMISLALSLLDPGPADQVLDLFCGIGNFTLPLALRARRVIGIEGSAALVSRAEENAMVNAARLAGSDLAFQTADLYAATLDPAALPAADLLLLDPPRSGAEAVARNITTVAPRRVVYVSCHPGTLARDARLFAEGGYMLSAAGILDMFPHTAHVESIAVFTPNAGN